MSVVNILIGQDLWGSKTQHRCKFYVRLPYTSMHHRETEAAQG